MECCLYESTLEDILAKSCSFPITQSIAQYVVVSKRHLILSLRQQILMILVYMDLTVQTFHNPSVFEIKFISARTLVSQPNPLYKVGTENSLQEFQSFLVLSCFHTRQRQEW